MGALTAAAAVGCEARDEMDVFDELPDHLVLHILNLVGDARSLARCRPVCRRLNALASHADRLLIRVDAVIRAQPRLPCPGLLPLLGHVLRSALQSLSGLVSQKSGGAAEEAQPLAGDELILIVLGPVGLTERSAARLFQPSANGE